MLIVEKKKKKKVSRSWLFAVCFFFVIISYLHGWWIFWSYILYLLEIFLASRIWYYFVVNEISCLLIVWALGEKVFFMLVYLANEARSIPNWGSTIKWAKLKYADVFVNNLASMILNLNTYIKLYVYIYTCIKMFLYRLDSGQDSFSLICLALSLIGLIGWLLLVSLTKISRV